MLIIIKILKTEILHLNSTLRIFVTCVVLWYERKNKAFTFIIALKIYKGASAVHLTRIWSDNDMSKVDLSILNKGLHLEAVHFVMNNNN